MDSKLSDCSADFGDFLGVVIRIVEFEHLGSDLSSGPRVLSTVALESYRRISHNAPHIVADDFVGWSVIRVIRVKTKRNVAHLSESMEDETACIGKVGIFEHRALVRREGVRDTASQDGDYEFHFKTKGQDTFAIIRGFDDFVKLCDWN